MKWLARVIFVLALSAAGGSAIACQCGKLPSEEEAWRNAALVFQGEVVSISPVLAKNLRGEREVGYEVTFAVSREGKALGYSTRRLVQRSIKGGSCDGPFEVGLKYIVFAEPNEYFPGAVRADVCHQPREREGALARLVDRPSSGALEEAGASILNKFLARLLLRSGSWTGLFAVLGATAVAPVWLCYFLWRRSRSGLRPRTP